MGVAILIWVCQSLYGCVHHCMGVAIIAWVWPPLNLHIYHVSRSPSKSLLYISVDNVTTSSVGCGVEVCYNVNAPDTPTTLNEFKVHLSPCNNRSVVGMRSFPVTEDRCIRLDHLQTDTCYTLRYEGGVRIGLMALPSDTTQTVQVRVDQCRKKPTGNDYFLE